MLVIRRRAGESLLIGEDVEIQILDVSPTRVKLGIVAPKNVTILRSEVRLTKEQNLAAAGGVTESGILGLVRSLSQMGAGRLKSIGEKP
jgi:carbon storage regulator